MVIKVLYPLQGKLSEVHLHIDFILVYRVLFFSIYVKEFQSIHN
jgi:hypothetical protein